MQSTVVVNAQADARPSKAGNIATLGAHYMNRMPGSAPATTSVAPAIRSTQLRSHCKGCYNPPQVVSVKEVSRSDVYCLTVPSFGCFELCGVAVSNCDTSTYPIVYEMPVVKPVAQIQVSIWGRR